MASSPPRRLTTRSRPFIYVTRSEGLSLDRHDYQLSLLFTHDIGEGPYFPHGKGHDRPEGIISASHGHICQAAVDPFDSLYPELEASGRVTDPVH